MALHSTRTQVVTVDPGRWLNVPDACLKKLCSQNYKTIKALQSRNLEAAIGCLDCHSLLSLQTGRQPWPNENQVPKLRCLMFF